MQKIALVTPLQNEINNLSELYKSIEKQTTRIFSWVIVENDSIDGSKEFLLKNNTVKNVDQFHIIHLSFNDKTYQLGFKYSTIIKHGFDFLKKMPYYNELDFIGILDADCFPENNYYKHLIDFMNKHERIGLASGRMILLNGKPGFSNDNHVRGSGRLWKKKCFDESDYTIGMSADSNSRTKAIIRGWKVEVDPLVFFTSREANSRVSLEYAGKSAYYNGFTIPYVLTKSFYYLFRNPKISIGYFKGYFRSAYQKVPKNPDDEIVFYNRDMFLRKMKNLFRNN